MATTKLQHLILGLASGAALVLWTACTGQASGGSDEFEGTEPVPSSAGTTPSGSGSEVCLVNEEGVYTCGELDDANGTDPGSGTSTNPGGGTTGGDCPEEGCPDDGSGGSSGGSTTPGGGTSTNPGGGTTGGDCPEEGCPDDGSSGGSTTPGGGTSTNPGDGTVGGDCPEEGCPDDGSSGGSTTPGGGTSTDPGGGGTTVTPVCDEETFTPSSSAEADLLLVVDRSGSMEEIPPAAGTTKWDQVRDVITSVTAELDDTYGFGLMFYPAGGGESLQCVAGSVAVSVGDGNGAAIAGAFWATGPAGGTPTAPTLRVAASYLRNRVTTRPQAVVLATDGAPNCNPTNDINSCVCSQSSCTHSLACLDDSNTIGAVQELAQAGIATFVVGIPGTELFAGVLDQMATAGGTAVGGVHKYYDAGSQQALEDALRQIGRRVSQCRFELQNAPLSTTVAVTVDGSAVARDPGRVNGWDYVGAHTIEFFGPACQALGSGGSVVRVEYCAAPQG